MNRCSRLASSKCLPFQLLAALSLRRLRALGALAAIFVFSMATTAQSAHYGGVTASFNFTSPSWLPLGVAVDSRGDVLIADGQLGKIYEVQAVNGVLPASPTPVAIATGFNQPSGLAFDGSGNLFVADSGNGAIKEIVATGGVIAPNSTPKTVHSNAASWPSSVAVDANGNVFFTDQNAPKAVYEIVASGGQVSTSSPVQTLALNSFSWAWDIFFDAQGNLFVTDYNANTVSEFVASNGSVSSSSALLPVASGLAGPRGIVADSSGNLFVAEYGNEDLIEIAAGSWNAGTPTPRSINGGFYDPSFLAAGLHGEIYVADTNHYLIKKVVVDPPDFGSVAVGSSSATFQIPFTFDSNTKLGGTAVRTDGATGKDFVGASGCQANTTYTAGQTCLLAVQFSPQFPGLRLGSAELLDTGGNILVRVPLHGVGTAPQLAFVPAKPAPNVLPLNSGSLPWGVAVDANKNVYFSDPANYTIGMISASTQQETLFPFDYYFSTPQGIALDGAGNLFVADSGNGTISEIQAGSNGQISAASNIVPLGSGFSSPMGIAVDGQGNVFVADAGSNAIYEIVADSTGQITSNSATLTIASSFNSPTGLALDLNGNLYVADTANGAVKEIVAVNGHVSPASQVVTISTDFPSPIGLAVDAAGNLYVSDSGSETISVVLTGGAKLSTTSTFLTLDRGLSYPTGVAVSKNGDVYFADQGTGLVQQLALSTPPSELDFPTPTSIGVVDAVDGAQSLTLINNGNATLDFPLSLPSAPSSFTLSSDFLWSDATGCSPYGTLTLASGFPCTMILNFKPTVFGPIAGALSFQSNSLNAASPSYAPVSIALNGTGLPVNSTTFTVSFSAGANGTVMGLKTQTVLFGSSTASVYVQPDPDAGFMYWIDGGGNYYSSDWGIVINNVTANQSYTALFYLAQLPGKCGSANGRNLSHAPGGQDLCSQGTASLVSGSGPWNWSCGGQNGGSTASCSAHAQPTCDGTVPCIVTVAGGGPNNMPALSSPLYYPDDVVGDSKGNVYIGNQEANRVFKVDPSGTLTVFAGNGENYGVRGDEGPAVNAEVSMTGLAIDANDNIYIIDSFGSIRKVTADGIIHTVAGGIRGYYGDGIDARLARFWDIEGVAFDRQGNMFIADNHNNIIREITTDGIIHTVAGNVGANGFSGDGGPATQAVLNSPHGVAVDSKGNVFVADTGAQRIRMFTVGGNISTVAGSETQKNSDGSYYNDYQGDGGPATQALFSGPYNVAVDSQDRVYVADFWNGRVRRFTVGGNIDTIVGNGQGYTGDGPATSVGISGPYGLAFDKDGNLLIGTQWDNLVRKLNFSNNNLTTVAGNHLAYLGGDGYTATQASLTTGSLTTGCYYMNVPISRNCPRVAIDSTSNLYIADSLNNSIRKVNAQTGIISTFAGSTAGIAGYSGNGGPGYAAGLNTPMGMAFDASGNLYFADSQNNVIREIDKNNNISTIAGNGSWGCGYADNADATQGQLCNPLGVTVDLTGNVYVADSANCVIRKIAPPDNNGLRGMTTVAGQYAQGNCSASWPSSGANNLSGDSGPATSATLAYPMAVAVDRQGNLFIADSYNLAIRRVDAQTHVITSVAGVSSQIGVPVDLALDGVGDIFFTQTNNAYSYSTLSVPYVSELKPDGTLQNIAGIGTPDFSGDGGSAAQAALDTPSGVALDAAGNLYIYDSSVGRVRKVNSVGQGGLPLGPKPKTTPTINWATPTAITYGTALSTTQLNATASVPGSFVYAPVAGTVLNAGAQTLTATFTPTDTADYTTATATVSLTVNKAALLVSANNLSKSVGADNPALTFTVSGFVNGENSAVLSGTPTLSTTATASSPAGHYPITIAPGTLAAANYTFTSANGTLSVVAPPTVILSATAVLSKITNGYMARVLVTNSGTGTASGVQLNTAMLGTATGSPLPQGPISIAPGGTGVFSVTFPPTVGADGTPVAEKFAGVYSGGTFSLSLRAVTLP
jgi:sugar lactone lactonase YvrE